MAMIRIQVVADDRKTIISENLFTLGSLLCEQRFPTPIKSGIFGLYGYRLAMDVHPLPEWARDPEPAIEPSAIREAR